MAKQQPLSPQKYITTKARTLPIYKCYVTAGWEEDQIANVVVMRRHVNGHLTVGLYLVDLLCLGVKDTFYAFNISEEEATERFIEPQPEIEEVDYNLTHNIVFAGHDFALEFDIKPHKGFDITKYILEEDTEKIPVLEIPVGDENGNPVLVVAPFYNYGPALQKLKQHAGEGNYKFVIQDDLADDDDVENDDDFDEDDLDDEDDDDDEEVEPIDFDIVANMETEQLEEMIEDESESFTVRMIVKTELLLRQLDEEENGTLIDTDLLKETKEYRLFEKGKEQWEKAGADTKETVENIFPEVRDLVTNAGDLSEKNLMAKALKLLNNHIAEEIPAFAIVNSIPLMTLLSELGSLENNFDKYTPAVQIFIASYVVLRIKEPDAKYQFLFKATTVEMAYPFNRHIHGLHHKLFWFLQAIHALQQNDKERILHYHNLLRISGTGGDLKFLYAAQLETWLKLYMGLDDEEDDLLDFEMLDDDEESPK